MVRSAAALVAVLILPAFAWAQEPQATHTVVRGNTLWDLAQFYYSNPFEWPVIWRANTSVVEDPHWIYPDEVLVIPGLPGTEQTPPVTDLPTAGPPEVPPDLIPFGFREARPSDETRTIFYRDMEAQRASVIRSSAAEHVAVSGDAVYSAPWLIDLEVEPEHTGVVEGFAEGNQRASTIRSFQRARVSMPSPARVGASLQIFRVDRTIEDVGQVVIPTGVLTVSTIGDGFVVGSVVKEYHRILPGDMVRPLPAYVERPGVYAEEVSGGSEALVVGMAGVQVLSDLGHIAFLDLGSVDDVAIGDEFVLYGRAVPTAMEGSLQVVGVSENTSAARILSMTDDVFRQGVVVRLAKKMR
jgi:hypothetical protein